MIPGVGVIRIGFMHDLSERLEQSLNIILALSIVLQPLFRRQFFQSGIIGIIGLGVRFACLHDVVNLSHNHGADGVDGIVATQPILHQFGELDFDRFKPLSQLIFHHHVTDGMQFLVGQFDLFFAVKVGDQKHSLHLIE